MGLLFGDEWFPHEQAHELPPYQPTISAQKENLTKGLSRKVRKIRYPELFKLKYSVDMILDRRIDKVGYDAWVQDVLIEDQDRSSPVPKFVFAYHPGFANYEALFEYVDNPRDGPAYYCTSIAHEPPEEDHLPADVDAERWGHLRGKIGEHRPFSKKDLEIIRYCADRRLPREVSTERLNEGEDAASKESERVQGDYLEDLHDYYFNFVHDVANGGEVYRDCTGQLAVRGTKMRSFPDEAKLHQPKENPEIWSAHEIKQKKLGDTKAKIRVRKGSKLDRQIASERAADVEADLRKLAQENESQALKARARAVTLGQRAKSRRTM